jgi:polar amino acid transport system substrate-binding protein
MLRPHRRAGAVTLAFAVTAGLAACGSSSSGGAATSSSGAASASTSASASASGGADAALAAMVPAAVKSDGTITIGTDSTYAPSEFLDTDGKTVKGFDVDLFNAVAAKLGLKTQWVSAPFANIIPGVTSGKYEIGVSSFTVNADRMKATDMVSYFSAGTQWATQTGNPQAVSADSACGKKVAVQTGTVQVDDVTARSKKCTTAGKTAITIDQYQGQDMATAAVVSGKDDAMLADSPVVAYAVKQTAGKLALLGSIYDSAPYGYVLKKGEEQFPQALAGALKAIQADGTYKSILDKWGVSQGAIDSFAVNPSVG